MGRVVTGADNNDLLALAFHKERSLLSDIVNDGSVGVESDRLARGKGGCAGMVSAGLSHAC